MYDTHNLVVATTVIFFHRPLSQSGPWMALGPALLAHYHRYSVFVASHVCVMFCMAQYY